MKINTQLSVFLVDDDKLFSTALIHQLEKMFKAKTTVHSFSTGEECLEHLGQAPNIILLDYFLNSSSPDAMNGLEVLKRIKKEKPNTKVIMLSAQDKMEVAVDTIKHGAYDYVIKNDKVFLRTKHVVFNAANAIADSTDLRNYRFWVRIVSGLILLMIGGCMVVQLNYPGVF